MDGTTLPSLRVSKALRRRVEAALEAGETISSFILHAVESQTAERESQQEFIARGLASSRKTRATGRYVDSEDVLAELDALTDKRRGPRPSKRR